MQKRKRVESFMVASVLVGVLTLLPVTATADMSGFHFDLSGVYFKYEPGVGPGVGRITINEGLFGTLAGSHYGLGTDEAWGGAGPAADTLRDYVAIGIGSPSDWTLAFSADAYKLGANDYMIQGSVSVTDASGTEKLLGDFTSIYVDPDEMAMAGNLVFDGSFWNTDGVLRPGGVDDWVFTGTSGSDVSGGDGNPLTMTLGYDRGAYDSGDLFNITAKVGSYSDLDAFFGSSFDVELPNRTDMKIDIIPVPAALVLGAVGLVLVGWVRRRVG